MSINEVKYVKRSAQCWYIPFSTFFSDDKNENDTSSADVFMFADSVI